MPLKLFRDNPSRYWFRRRLYGWGWTPARLPGFAVLLVFLGYVVWCAMVFDKIIVPTTADTQQYIAKLSLGVVILTVIALLTGEPPRWQWGRRRE
jgi:hypothetical protein